MNPMEFFSQNWKDRKVLILITVLVGFKILFDENNWGYKHKDCKKWGVTIQLTDIKRNFKVHVTL